MVRVDSLASEDGLGFVLSKMKIKMKVSLIEKNIGSLLFSLSKILFYANVASLQKLKFESGRGESQTSSTVFLLVHILFFL